MCGRFALALPPKSVAEHFQLDSVPDFSPRYNIAPTQDVLTVDASGVVRHTVMRRWGLIPRWAGDMKIGARMINARSETVADKPAFRELFRHRRCLIPASGFFEWKRTATEKEPYYIRLGDSIPMAFAGLWDRWEGGGAPLESCTILTTAANDTMKAIHDRMPVILSPHDYNCWLDPGLSAYDSLLPLLKPCPADMLEFVRVGDMVNRAANDDPRCIEPV